LHLWDRLVRNDAIYKGTHTGWYCISSEAFYPESRLKSVNTMGQNKRVTAEGGKEVELVSEVNYKFRLNDYLDEVRRWIERKQPVFPKSRLNDLHDVFEEGLPDLSVSCARSSNPWAIPVPSDDTQTIYVWLDALSNYLDSQNWSVPNIHVIGKDILKFHAVYWPAFLLAAGLPLPERIVTHGHWISGGEKMSKSIGNVIDPLEEMQVFGKDAFRYLLLRNGKIDGDAPYIHTDMVKRYDLDLANNLGNLVSRLSAPSFYPRRTLMERSEISAQSEEKTYNLKKLVTEENANMRFHVALEAIMVALGEVNAEVHDKRPWVAAKEGRIDELERMMPSLLFSAVETISLLQPVMPEYTRRLHDRLAFSHESLDVSALSASEFQFPRINASKK